MPSRGIVPPTRPGGATRNSNTTSPSSWAGRVYVFLTSDGFPTDPYQPDPPELGELQEAYRRHLTSTGKDLNPASSREDLERKIRSLPLKVELLGEELGDVEP